MNSPRTIQLVFFNLRLVLYTCVQTLDVIIETKKLELNTEAIGFGGVTGRQAAATHPDGAWRSYGVAIDRTRFQY
jgi:hypothetical protein